MVVVTEGREQSRRQLYVKTAATGPEKKAALKSALRLDKKQVSRKIPICSSRKIPTCASVHLVIRFTNVGCA